MPNMKVIKPGLCTTIQDIGRIGYQQYGIPVSGVMDEFAFRVANFLVEADENNAVLEIPYLGPTLEFDFDVTIAITGANLNPKINGQDITMWRSMNIKKGDVLTFSSMKSGARAYLAFAAEIDVPLVNGSKSTLLKSKLGGFEGRQLNIGDVVNFKNPKLVEKRKILASKYIPQYLKSEEIRVVLGPQDDYFTEKGIKTFLNSEYEITKEADRMGMRLEGEFIEHKNKADIISDAAVFGSIQVPGNGKPIILLADRQTTGGYTKIATVIKADLPKLAQMTTGNKIRFKNLNIEEAEQEYRNFYNRLEEIKNSMVVNKKTYSEKELKVLRKLFGERLGK
ncbi:biotin-dependent carboxyltransferase family protein [Fusobacterium russii]|uniref:5-oxoprolinase subunit C family protein n=1 Tax=Fusobacterium russii TaxID=854 RepID=UPI0003AA0430|nr:biotin-dependent carboxyltransferase family protein [Fusobacterium russii]